MNSIFHTNLRDSLFLKIIKRVRGRGLDSTNVRTQVSSSCMSVRYEYAWAYSIQSPTRIRPLSYFILQPERGHKFSISKFQNELLVAENDQIVAE